MDTLVSIKVFREVVEEGTFVAAGKRHSLSTAMVSKHVMHLERKFGTRLLNRSSRSLSLTEAGRVLFERSAGILGELQEVEVAVGALGGPPRGTLRIICPTWSSSHRMGELLAAYRRRCPDVTVDIRFQDHFVDIIKEGYDLALWCTAEPLPGGLVARRLRTIPVLITASPEYLKKHGVPGSLEELERHAGIMVGPADAWEFSGPNGRKTRVQPRVVLRMDTVGAAAYAVSAGIGLAALPLAVIEDPVFLGRLRPVLPRRPLSRPGIYAVYASRQNVPAKTRTFIDHMIEYMASVPLPRVMAGG